MNSSKTTDRERPEPRADPLVAVFDANVLIPLCLPSGRSLSTRLLARLRAGGHLVAVSEELLEEVEEKLRTKRSLRTWLGIDDADVDRFLLFLPDLLGRRLNGRLTDVPRVVPDDPDDDIVVATAVQAEAHYIVTEDAHLLRLGSYQGIAILTRRDFAAELDRQGVG